MFFLLFVSSVRMYTPQSQEIFLYSLMYPKLLEQFLNQTKEASIEIF